MFAFSCVSPDLFIYFIVRFFSPLSCWNPLCLIKKINEKLITGGNVGLKYAFVSSPELEAKSILPVTVFLLQFFIIFYYFLLICVKK